jgi:hypothetical protein
LGDLPAGHHKGSEIGPKGGSHGGFDLGRNLEQLADGGDNTGRPVRGGQDLPDCGIVAGSLATNCLQGLLARLKFDEFRPSMTLGVFELLESELSRLALGP